MRECSKFESFFNMLINTLKWFDKISRMIQVCTNVPLDDVISKCML